MKENTLKRSFAVCIALFAVYGILTFIGALRHEIWFDESQAWTIARDNDIAGIISMLKYEGHPPLWHFILYAFSHLGFGCEVIPLISWFFSVITVWIILFKLPLGLPLKAAVIFSNGFLFYNSVISRVYCLIPLLLCLIALVYPNRRKHPVLFGILVALLANTHIFVCGIVGIIGIYMLIDLFKDWKGNSVKQNLFNLIGLGIAGLGVLLLVIPLLDSLNTNASVSDVSFSPSSIFSGFAYCLFNVSNSAFSSFIVSPWTMPFVIIMQCIFIILLILLRHWRKALIFELTFIVFYTITSEIIWCTIPNRAAIFIFSFVFTFVLAQNSIKPVFKESSRSVRIDSKLLQRIVNFWKKCDKNAAKTYNILITALLVLTIPSGAIYLFKDYSEQFCPTKKAAEFIESNLEKDAVFVSDSDFLSQFSAYLPEYKFYALDYAEFYTYSSHKFVPEEKNYEKIYNDLAEYEHLYYIISSSASDHPESPRNVIYNNREGITFCGNICYIEISKFDLDYFLSTL